MFSIISGEVRPLLKFRRASLCSLFAGLIFLLQPNATAAASSSADTLVLVNSTSSRYLEFRNYIQPYLDHFGIPYSVQDIATNEVGTNLTSYALIIIGHALLDTNHVYFSAAEQTNLMQAVAAGTGLVNFDFELSGGVVVTNYPYVQSIFGFTYPGGYTGAFNNQINFFATEAGGQLHYISSRHPTNTVISLRTPINMLNFTAPASVKVLARTGGQPVLAVNAYGLGRAVQWGTYAWINNNVKGPLSGFDDLVWRSLIWAARKPFVMRGLPNFVSMRADDAVGPFDWIGIANEYGFKPWVGPFITSIQPSNTAVLRTYATNGLCTVSPHSFTPGDFIYWNHNSNTNWSDTEVSNRMYWARQWHLTNNLPLSKVIVAHTSEVGPNAFPWFQQWGSDYFTIYNEPGTPRISQWLVAGPFRKYVPTLLATENLPLCYADFFEIAGHPELSGRFFNCTTVIRDDPPCNEWCPSNDVNTTVGHSVRILKRAFDSLAQAVLYSHEAYIQSNGVGPVYTPSITTTNWRTILSSITNQIADYNPQYVTLDYSCQYIRATRTTKITAAAFDPSVGQMNMTFTGRADLNLSVQVYVGEDNAITNIAATIPAFTNSISVAAQITLPPAAPPLLAGTMQSNNFTLLFNTTPGRDHQIEYRSVSGGDWLPWTNFTAGNTNAAIATPLVQTQRFYRVRIPVN